MNAYNSKYSDIIADTDEYHAAIEARAFAWETCKNLPSSRYIMCNVSTEVVDKDGDLAIVDAYVADGQTFVERGGQVTRNHSNHTIGTVWKVFKGVDSTTDKPCVIACLNLFKGAPIYERAWKEFLTRPLKWSIGSRVNSVRECNSTTCYNRIVPLQWFELAMVDYPRNPVTYNIEYNDKAKGINNPSVIEIHEDECPILRKYNEFKEEMAEHGITAHIIDGGVMLLVGDFTEDINTIIDKSYPEYTKYSDEVDEGAYTVLIPHHVDTSDEFLESIMALVEDEREAIEGYNTVMESLISGDYLTQEDLEKVSSAIEEVKHDEEEHIGVLLGIIKEIMPDMYSSIADGMEEADEEMNKGCPAGQHEHAGIVGCHDIFRKHAIDYKTNPMQTLDLTDENIDISAIKDTPTPKLREIVVKIAKVLSAYDSDAVKKFMSSTAGKEFVLAYMELKRRQMQEGVDGMSESNIKDAAPADAGIQADAEKGLVADPQTSIATIASTLASIVGVIDSINVRITRMEAALAEKTEEHTDITDAILSDDSIVAEEKTEAPVAEPKKAETEDTVDSAVPAPVESTDGVQEEKTEEETKEDSKDDSEEKVEEETKVEDKDEDKTSDESDSKSSDDDSKDEKTEEKKEEVKEEDKEEEKDAKKGEVEEETESMESEEETVKENLEEEEGKGCSGPAEAIKSEDAPVSEEENKAEVPKEVTEEVAEVAEEAKADPEPTPAPIEVAKSEEEPVVEEMAMPVPPGGNVVDFRSAIIKRQEELKAKGVTYTYGQSASSLAQVPGTIQATNGMIVQPSSVKAFNVDAPKGTTMQDLWKDMGKYDPKTFFNKLKGE